MEKLSKTAGLLTRWALFPLSAIAGFCYGGAYWKFAIYCTIVWVVFAVFSFFLTKQEKLALSIWVIVDAILKSLVVGALLSTVLVRGGYHDAPLLMFSPIVVAFLLWMTHAIFRRSGKLDALPGGVEYGVLVLCIAWSVEAAVYVLLKSQGYSHTGLSGHEYPIAIAVALWTVAMGLYAPYSQYRDASRLYQDVRNMAQAHVASRTLKQLRERLPKDLKEDRITTIKCYHSTSLLFGFWLNPLAKEEEDVNVLSYALKKADIPVAVQLIGPSPIVLEYLTISRLHKLMREATSAKKRIRRDAKEDWDLFLKDIHSGVSTQVSDIGRVLATDILREHESEGWWYMMDALRWYLLYIYYQRLGQHYSVDLSTRCQVSVLECARYDQLIRKTLTKAARRYKVKALMVKSDDGGRNPMWHIRALREWHPRIRCLMKAVYALDQVFFPEYAFAILSPNKVDVSAGTRSKYLLCHNVLNTLAFSCLRRQPKPAPILHFMHDDLVLHYETAFESEWGSNDPGRPRLTYLNLDECRIRWAKLAGFAWETFCSVVKQAKGVSPQG